MVAGVIVVIRHRGVEDHPREQFRAVRVGLLGPAPDLVRQQRIRPPRPIERIVVAVEHGHAADQPIAQVALARRVHVVLAIEAPQQQHVELAHGLQARLGDIQPAAPGEFEGRELDTLQTEPVVGGGEFAEPEAVFVLDRRLGPRTAHAGAGLELLEEMRRNRAAVVDLLRSRDQVGQLVGPVVPATGCGRLGTQSERQRSGAILRAVEQVVDLVEIGGAAFEPMLDHAPAPCIGRGVADRAGDARELRELVDLPGQR